MNDLVRVASLASGPFGWGSKYVDMLITSAGAVYRSEGLDEKTDDIDISVAAVFDQAQRLIALRRAQGASPRTISSYVASWKRLAAVARHWMEAGKPGGEDEAFWQQTAKQLADTRVRRRAGRTRVTPAGTDGVFEPDETVTLTVRLSDGSEARLELPAHFTEPDLLAVITAIGTFGMRHGRGRGSSRAGLDGGAEGP